MKRTAFLKSLGLMSGGLAFGHIARVYGSGSPFETLLRHAGDDDEFWKIIREQFIFPEDYIYLNTGGIGAVPSLVLNKVAASMNEMELHPKPGHSLENWRKIKENCAHLLGPDCSTSELALIGCASEGINIILNGLGLQKGDEVITSTHEHPAVHIPLINQHRMKQVIVKSFDPDMVFGRGNVERIASLINKKTRLILLSHITCTTGQIFPLKEISRLARQHGIVFAVDGAQAPGSMEIDLRDAGVDFYTCSGHKWMLGPKRTGILYVPSENLDVLQPTAVGTYSDKGYDIKNLTISLQDSAQRYEYGTQNESLFLGLGAGTQFVRTIGLKRIREHNRKLAELFYSGLKQNAKVEVLSPEEEQYRSSMISFRIPGIKAEDIAGFLSTKSVRVRIVNEAGLNAVRVSFHVYNQEFEVHRILECIDEFLNQ